jgi:hypothetical protein
VLPVFVSDDEDPEKVLEDSSFQPVWDVLKAMRAHDEDLAETIDDLRRSLGRDPSARVRRPEKISLDLPAKVGEEFARAFDVRLVEQTTASWQFVFGLLARYVEREGSARVPARFVTGDGWRLGAWVNTQRVAYDRHKVSPDRQARLEALPGWTWEPFDDAWERAFQTLQHFSQRSGRAQVPRTHVEHGFRLYAWVNEQRMARRTGRLDPDRQARLEELPGWTWEPFDDLWEAAYGALRQYVEREGDPRVLKHHREDGLPLGRWVEIQRRLWRRGKLSPDRQARLEALPAWTWDPVNEAWERGFQTLRRFVRRSGHTRVPRDHVEDGLGLGAWVNMQRMARRRAKLDPDRQARLEALPGWEWNPLDDSWEGAFETLQRFVQHNGHSRVPQDFVQDGVRLSAWLNRQRMARRKGTLDPQRAARLEALPGWSWDIAAPRMLASWEQAFDALQRFAHRERHTRVPEKHVEGSLRLGAWVSRQRIARSRGRLDPDRQARLEALPGWEWNPLDDSWEGAFETLQRFAQRNGHCRVPQDHVQGGLRLGAWLNRQRLVYRANRLDPERQRRLEALPEWDWGARRASARGQPRHRRTGV